MEHRHHPRFPVQFRSSFSSANIVSGDGQLSDLSIRGCCVSSATGVKPGTILQLRIVPGDEPSIQVKQAVVRWRRDHSFGLEFTSLAPDEWTRLQQVVRALEREPYQLVDSSNEAV
ncbi:MAG: PilZ domain-containing protein [Nitrospira sp.]|nr:MAG: PilZ domain-containing protein [Nitrospira sp.]